jgi:N4-(beta-N-acetylglucosaminyl)-L-asparaginase
MTMESNRRQFIKLGTLLTSLMAFNKSKAGELFTEHTTATIKPIVLSTWRFGVQANAEAWKVLSGKGRALDAVEAGVKLIEADPAERSVGYGGRPDRDGKVTLDACIMDEFFNIGSVACLEHIMHPVSVARAVMEKTPHTMLCGEGALEFSLAQGFTKQNLLVKASEEEWKEWLKTSEYKPKANIENHDTIGMIAMDMNGNLSGACSTSGMAFKMHGRVGDSPIIGSGLFVDNEVGAATATGQGEDICRVVGAHTVVEFMRQGHSPEAACKKAVERIAAITKLRNKELAELQVGFIAINKKGEHGAYCLQKGFNYAVYSSNISNELVDAKSYLP